MTPAERLAQRLEGDAYSLPSTWKVGDSPEWDHVNSCTEAAALIRRLAAALVDANDVIKTAEFGMLEYFGHGAKFRERHAEALRDIREET